MKKINLILAACSLMISTCSFAQNTIPSTTVSGSATIDSLLVVKDTIVAKGDVRIVGDLKVKGDTKLKGKLKVDGVSTFDDVIKANQGIDLGGGLGFKSYISSTPNVGKITIIGGSVAGPPGGNSQDDPPACVVSTGVNPNVNGWIAGIDQGYYSSSTLGGNNSFLTMYASKINGNGYIDISGLNSGGNPTELFINNNCGRNTRINWLNGTVFMGESVFMKRDLVIGDPANGTVNGAGVQFNIKKGLGFNANIVGNVNPADIDAFKLSKNGTDRFNVNGEGQTVINSINSDALIVKNNSNTQNGFTIKNDGSAIINTYDSYTGSAPILNIKNMNLSASPNPWNQSIFEIQANGKTLIGNQRQFSPGHSDALLQVFGKMVATSCYIRITNWSDYVFAKDYKLPSLYDIEKFYLANNHLPEIPTEQEVKENGIEIGEMNSLLLKKIEELTILMVQQQKEIDALKLKIK